MLRSHMLIAIVVLGAAAVAAVRVNAAPPGSLAPDSRCFEMRTYTAAPGKLEALHARFRDHTNKLFVKHGMTLIGYWVPRDKDKGADNTLVVRARLPRLRGPREGLAGLRRRSGRGRRSGTPPR